MFSRVPRRICDDVNMWLAVAAGLVVFAALAGWPLRPAARLDCAGNTVLQVAGGRDVSIDHQQRAIIDSWDGAGPAAEYAELVELPPVADQQHSQMLAWARSRGCPAVDVYILDTQWIPEFARGGYIEPISPNDVDMGDVLPNIRKAVEYDGRTWAVPFNADAALLYYRTDLDIEKPRTWSDLWQQAQRLLMDDDNGLSSGYAPQFGEYEGMTVNALELIWAAGGDLIDRHGQVTVDREPVRRLLETLLGQIGDESPAGQEDGGRPVIGRSALDHFEADSIKAFADGRVAFMRSWPYAYARLANNEWMGSSDKSLKFAVAELPGSEDGRPGRSVLGGQSLAIDARSPHKRAALALIRHLVSEESQQRLFSCGGFAPVLRRVYLSPEQCPSTDSDRKVVRRLPDEQVGTLLRAVETARPRPAWPYYTEVSRVLSRGLRDCLSGLRGCDSPAGVAAFTDELAGELTVAMRGR
ncbi:carbohydrate ABC transporter substrate-binding protein, CUT1 family [Thermomonospora echinospora]|uniref:Carbohydrate ABC transporter substrate-binding protein, CUT1 family n=1 Tax=Thermomonospora echinospora TaxID=1992 RepID=A0A1H5TDH7_9ACTN|nr:extracellular solute-binding protein [Thermomonospora echinospora]SEF60823.1 carbohydrate ABC transporter substrate-binding protein, CUT1 family [Thermomonospora echinospora]